MKRILLFLTVLAMLCASCRWIGFRHVKGNGHLSSETRQIAHANRISVSGSFDVELTQGATTSVKVEADENIIPHIVTVEEDGVLKIRPRRNNTSFSSEHSITIYITTPTLEQCRIAGSGDIKGAGKFTGDKLLLTIAGSGNIDLDVNTPEVRAEITGSGNMTLRGETMTEDVHINGMGDYRAEDLKSENAKVRIAGSGDVKVFADATLEVNIAGSGTVYYKGSATVKQKVMGSGDIKKIE